VGTIVHELGKVCCNRGIRPPGWKTVKEGAKNFGACNAFLRTKLTDQIVETWRSETVFFFSRGLNTSITGMQYHTFPTQKPRSWQVPWRKGFSTSHYSRRTERENLTFLCGCYYSRLLFEPFLCRFRMLWLGNDSSRPSAFGVFRPLPDHQKTPI